ncbi:hypothetical protein SMGD1_2710 [Sulfurimonas gotlandica GD1]|uniref:Uncharacterized protein n=1 Tax=Sulfurimonas gotlandica (strain DSM 19862 / JCM 16533 / GD1) TaxID=929558 RepID=B6BJI7_SULGG|nr:DUF1302 family protein [Sulfurimonas gotlandica]EDZ62747.1 hypothetical protein CBGD1_2314 [Sulfurimonas gotlandica GD1]EHP31232.1 hypothetical protein SMGD1_2710 [Sulfurimonas gotlandica GD1]
MLGKVLLSSFISISLASSVVHAKESIEDDLSGFDSEVVVKKSSGSDADLAGFDDEVQTAPNTKKETTKVKEQNRVTISGDLAFKASVGYKEHKVDGIEYSGINQAQSSLSLELDAKLSDNWKLKVSGDAFYDAIYDIHSTNNYSDDILDAYKTQLRLDDTYVQGKITSALDAKIGRQIVVWGKSDSIRITDVINPLDNRTPAMTDIEDLRLSVGMFKFDYYYGVWNFSAMIIPENRIMIEAPARSEYFPVDAIFPIAPNPFLELETPNTSWDNMQYAFGANGVFSGWDLSFYAADVLDQKWHIDPDTMTRKVTKIQMLGSAINIASGSWLLKSEVALLDGVKYNSTRDAKSRLDALIGFDYMGIKDTVLSVEVANRHIFDYEAQMSKVVPRPDYVDEDEVQTALRATRSFYNDSLNATALLSIFGSSWQNGGFARVWIEYEVANAIGLNAGIVEYIDGDKPLMKAIRDNDRIFADITYSF